MPCGGACSAPRAPLGERSRVERLRQPHTELFVSEKMKGKPQMKASLHIGKGSAKHNDRDFDTDLSDHIDPTRASQNFYHIFSNDPSDQSLTFEEYEKKFYDENFSNSLTRTNDAYIKNRHPERCKTMDEWYGKMYPPIEAIMQIGNQKEHSSPEELLRAGLNTVEKFRKIYPEIKVLDIALHDDEATPHLQFRFCIIGHDKGGNPKPLKTQGLKEMGIERPDMSKPESRYNNPMMTFTSTFRELLYREIESLGIDLDREPRPESQHLETIEYKKKQALADLNDIKAEIEDLKAEKDTLNDEIEDMASFDVTHLKAINKALKSENEALKQDIRVRDTFIKNMGLKERFMDFCNDLGHKLHMAIEGLANQFKKR